MSCGEQDGQGRGWPTIQGKQGECDKGRGSVRSFFYFMGGITVLSTATS